MNARNLPSRIIALVIAGLIVTSCAETVIELESEDGEVNVGGSFETIPVTTVPIVGDTVELLAEMSSELSRLSSEISAPGDEKATLDRIETIWEVARADVEANRPELVNGIDTIVDMARTAVVRIRPADGDKALQLLNDLVNRYNGNDS